VTSLDILSELKIFEKISEEIKRVAPYKLSVLINGEFGTGREHIAKLIHRHSLRSPKKFIFVNCATLNETLLERDLFGYEKSAFSNAKATHEGQFELANGGTIFLDEIERLSPNLQFKIFRALDEMEFERIGSNNPTTLDVRFVAGTSIDLKTEVQEGRFRPELYYRLNKLNLSIPPLRENKDDIPVLAKHFIKKHCSLNNKDIMDISKDCIDLLKKYHWPGNISELENIIERAIVMCNKKIITKEDLVLELRDQKSYLTNHNKLINIDMIENQQIPLPEILDQIEELIIRRALERSGNVQVRAAEMLGITKSLLQYKLKKYHLTT